MSWQLPVVGLSVALALAYVVWKSVRAWSGKAAGCGDCKCEKPAPSNGVALIPADKLTLRRRS